MRLLIAIMLILAIVACSNNESSNSNPINPEENPGTTQKFTVMGSNCTPVIEANGGNAQKYCADMGFDRYVTYTTRTSCGPNGWGSPKLATVTCWRSN